MVIFYVITLFLISGTSIFLFFKSVSPKIKAKNLSLIMVCLAINLLTIPMAYLIGSLVFYTDEMATEFRDSNPLYFWKGFFFIQAIPFLILIIGILKWLIDRGKINELINRIAL
ncbi:hypothetical protein [Bacillus sp. NPDC060175]|uniref:hypothetical protein n=1 Tax=Bacillus sp. NPDC060175 TaxID=3347061 RepID=UPI003662FAB8